MEKRNQGEVVCRVILTLPKDLWFVCQWITNCPKTALKQCCESLVLGLLRVSLESIHRQHWLLDRENAIYKICPVRVNARHIADSLCQALDGLENRVKVVSLHQFGFAVLNLESPPKTGVMGTL